MDLSQGGDFFRGIATGLRTANGQTQTLFNQLIGAARGADAKAIEADLKTLQGAGGSEGIDPNDPGLLEGVARKCDQWAVDADKAAADQS